MTVTPITGVSYWYDETRAAFTAPGRPDLPLDRASLVSGTYLPDATTTGVPAGTTLTSSGSVTYTSTSDGLTVTGRRFTGYVNVSGVQNLTFRYCWFEPPATGRTDRPTVLGRTARNENVLFEDCTFTNTYPDPYVQNGYMGRGTTLRRCDISGAVDGVGVAPAGASDRADVTIEDSWIHDLLYVRPYSGHSDNQTHSDPIQWHGGPGLTVHGNRIEGFMDTTLSAASWPASDFYPGKQTTSAIMVNSSSSFLPTGEMHITNNWINGGGVGINMVGVPSLFLTDDGSEIVGNHFGYDFGFANDMAVYCNSAHVFDFTDNYRWIAGNPLANTIPFNTRKFG